MAPNFSQRSNAVELMDDEKTDLDTFRACLVDLAKVNQLTLAYGPTLAFLDRVARTAALPRNRPLSILDVGSGYGDMLRKIDKWAERRNIPTSLAGIDLNPWSARAAQEATTPGRPIEWVTANVFDYKPQTPVDVVVSSLFTHHLDAGAVIRFVSWMERTAKVGWFINDLHRHPLPYHVFRTASRALRFHHFVQHDGPISIARAFDFADWRATLEAAGLAPGVATIEWRFPFRLCVARIRSP